MDWAAQSELWIVPHQYLPHWWTSGVHEGASPTNLKLQDLHDIDNPHDNKITERSTTESSVLIEYQKPHTTPKSHRDEYLQTKIVEPMVTHYSLHNTITPAPMNRERLQGWTMDRRGGGDCRLEWVRWNSHTHIPKSYNFKQNKQSKIKYL